MNRLLRALREGPGGDAERGSAIVEFLGGTVVLLIPLVYLVIALTQLQAATFAAQAAARDAGRIIATAEPATSQFLAAQSVTLAFADQGIAVDGGRALTVFCEDECGPGDRVLAQVAIDLPLPFLPQGTVSVPVSASAWTTVDPYREWP